MADHVMKHSKPRNKAHKARVSATEKREAKINNRLLPGAMLDPSRIDDPSRLDENNRMKDRYDVGSTMLGKWTRGDPRDTNMEILQRLVEKAKDGQTPFGQVMMPQDTIDYLKQKKEEEQAWHVTRFGSYLIDPKRPETQARAFELFPELKEYPDELHAENLAVQESLRTMLRNGSIGGIDDHHLIMRICRDDYELPCFPGW